MTDALFELEHPPPVRKGARDYLEHLAALPYHDDLTLGARWTFWALAPVHPAWARHQPTATVEHVWLTDTTAFYQALVDVQDGTIYRRRIYQLPHDHQDRKVST